MVNSLGKSIIKMYSMGAYAVLGMTNQEALSEDLEFDPFLTATLQRFTCELYYRFGSLLAPISIGIITTRHYFVRTKWYYNDARNRDDTPEERDKRTAANLG